MKILRGSAKENHYLQCATCGQGYINPTMAIRHANKHTPVAIINEIIEVCKWGEKGSKDIVSRSVKPLTK